MIPRIIHQFWDGGPLPDGMRRLARTWPINHPDWEYWLWDGESARRLLFHTDLWDHAPDIVPPDALWQFRSDLARWSLLWRFGGVWADMDTTCQRPLDKLLTHPVVVGWEIQNQWIGTSTIAATPRHPAVEDILDNINRAAQPGTRPNAISGPKAVTRILLTRRRLFKDVRVLDEHMWYPTRWNTPEDSDRPYPEAWIVHHWLHQRTLRSLADPGTPSGAVEVRGIVEDGSQRCSRIFANIPAGHWATLGYTPYPGSLNLRVGADVRAAVIQLEPVLVGNDRYWPARLAGEPCHVKVSRDPGTVEVVHPQRLRDRPGVTNGALLVLEVFDAPIGGDHGAPDPA